MQLIVTHTCLILQAIHFELFDLFVVCTQIYCCASSEPCCLRSTSQTVCVKRHDAHCPDCKLHSKSFSLDKTEKYTVCNDELTVKNLNLRHTARVLSAWAAHHRVKNYNRLPKDVLCGNIAKALSGDTSVLSKEKTLRRKRLSKLRPKCKKVSAKDSSAKKKSAVPPGYRSCICGTDECKETMLSYFRDIHDCTWPDKYFPWLYVKVPSKPDTSFDKKRRLVHVLKRADKLHRHNLFCRHLKIDGTAAINWKDVVVAFPVHFPLIW